LGEIFHLLLRQGLRLRGRGGPFWRKKACLETEIFIILQVAARRREGGSRKDLAASSGGVSYEGEVCLSAERITEATYRWGSTFCERAEEKRSHCIEVVNCRSPATSLRRDLPGLGKSLSFLKGHLSRKRGQRFLFVSWDPPLLLRKRGGVSPLACIVKSFS